LTDLHAEGTPFFEVRLAVEAQTELGDFDVWTEGEG
jgi:hypothetical protein